MDNRKPKETRRELLEFSSRAINTRLAELAAEYRFARCETVGKSLCGRKIKALYIGCGKKTVLYTGAHHGSEYLTASLLCNFAEEYCQAIDSGAKRFGCFARELAEGRCVVILPCVNPDGVDIALCGTDRATPLGSKLYNMNKCSENFSKWQANARGVDINHNYDYRFAEYKRLEEERGIAAGATRYSGAYPESEPETLAVTRLVTQLKSRLSLILSFHTQGEVIFYHDNERTRHGAAYLSRVSGYKLEEAKGLSAYGGLVDWADAEGIRAYTVECGRGENPLPTKDLGFIYASLREMLFTSPIFF